MAGPIRQPAAGQEHAFNYALIEVLLRLRGHAASLGRMQHVQHSLQPNQHALGARRTDATALRKVVLRPRMSIGGLASAEVPEDTEEGAEVWMLSAVVGGVGNVRRVVGLIHGGDFLGNAEEVTAQDEVADGAGSKPG